MLNVGILLVRFSRDLLFNVSNVIARELRGIYNTAIKQKKYGLRGVNCFAPVINIMRHPLWGRNQVSRGTWGVDAMICF